MRVITRRRGGKVVATITLHEKRVAAKEINPYKTPEGRICIPSPERADLTKREWQEYGELLRGIRRRVPEIVGVDLCSLSELRDVYESTIRCDAMRAVALYK